MDRDRPALVSFNNDQVVTFNAVRSRRGWLGSSLLLFALAFLFANRLALLAGVLVILWHTFAWARRVLDRRRR